MAGLVQFNEILIHGAESWRRQSLLLGPRDRRRKVDPEVAGSLKKATSKIFLMFSTHSCLPACLLSCFSRVRLCATPETASHPWDSPGKNTGVGCHFLLQCMKVKSESEVAQSCLTLATPWTAAHQAPLSVGFSRQKYWSGCHCLLRHSLLIPTNSLQDTITAVIVVQIEYGNYVRYISFLYELCE